MSDDPAFRLGRYRAFSEARLHFSRLYFQTVAFILLAGLLGAVLLRDAVGVWRGWLLVAAGLALVQTAFISWRLRQTEAQYETLLRALEVDPETPASGRFGAKTVVTPSLAVAGVALIAAGASLLG